MKRIISLGAICIIYTLYFQTLNAQEAQVSPAQEQEQAREQAIDYKNMTQVSAIFEIYKTKCEQYLNSNGRNWRQLYKAYVDKIKAQKEADKQKEKSN